MSEQKHTGGTWVAVGECVWTEYPQGGKASICTATPYSVGVDEAWANAARIVSCVNALAGIEDPAEFMEQLKEVLRSAYSACANPRTLGAIHDVMLQLGMSHDD